MIALLFGIIIVETIVCDILKIIYDIDEFESFVSFMSPDG